MRQLTSHATAGRVTDAEISELLKNVRGLNLDEVKRLGVDPRIALTDAVERSTERFAGYLHGKLCALWGVQLTCVIGRVGYLWVITTPAVDEYPFAFVRATHRVMEEMKQNYDLITGHVDADFEQSIKWLRWLNFEVGEPEKLNNDLVRQFYMRNN